ncbi:carbohydrate porin [Salinisphaera sp. S4-8]|uniref:carbohydrate porin n=1 Tax=Salinisphaera sp. S4-8 TaxID=633357 RepID=UPI0033406BE4
MNRRDTDRRLIAAVRRASILLAFAAWVAPALYAAEPTDYTGANEAPGIMLRDTLLGDIGGLRSAAEARGLSINAVVVGDYSIVLDGGADPRATAARYLFEAGLELDTDAAFRWPGGTLRVAYVGFHGDNGNLDSGDIQIYSNIDETPFDALYSLWYRQDLFDERLSVKLGKMDANEDFAYVENGEQFLNSSPGFSPTVLAFPSYPDPATGLVLFAELPAGVYARAGIYDGSTLNGRRTGTHGPDDFLTDDSDRFGIAETGINYRVADLDGRLGVGYWRHDGEFDRFDGGVEDASDGVYLVWDQSFYDDPGSSFAVDGFAQYVHANDAVSELARHIGAGVQITGLLADRPEDISGLMVSRVDFSDAPGADFTKDHETAIEIFHAIQVAPWMALKPDFQYIVNPGGMGLDDAKVATLRGEIAF